ncbi:MAG: HlyD family efflux transporter periplasmic adaptor subunit [Bacteroidales bacterium]|nr:HlyD family efflux transporter periplasmic adaptor subunit [Bacteroidales bacterium]MDD4394593.1 HlyD family efflux transporter periplasmic adaptor subunit [Bacteroidales bacterium]
MATKSLFLVIIVCFISCINNNHDADAYGVFEATEIIVSSENNGKLLSFHVSEGQTYQKGEEIGCIDTFQLHLQIQQLESTIRATLASRPDIPSQLNTLQSKLQTLEKERARITTLVEANAATTKQLDDVNAEIEITRSQIAATKSTLNTQSSAILENVEAMRFQLLQLEDAMEKCKIKAPITGTVLKKYIEPNELAFQGKPLFKIADITNMFIKVYVTEDMLSSIKLGQKAEIHIDMEDMQSKSYTGTVQWISAKAEFTPKMIQTKNERVNMVYAVKIAFSNDGSAKIGMPGDVIFK